MKVKFWGVRGSIPTPLTTEGLKSRIASIIQRVTCSDLESAETRELFLSRLPPYLFDLVGGNTTCVEINPDDGKCIIIDGGSGLRELGIDILKRRQEINEYHILLTHFHWDHLQGIPFFKPIFSKKNRIIFYNPKVGFENYVKAQMKAPFFPVEMDIFPAKIEFKVIRKREFKIGNTQIKWKKMKHPGECYAYRFVNQRKVIIFSTDSEITEQDFINNEENISFFSNAELLILDAQYTLEESIDKIDWGHTSYSLAVDFSAQWGIKQLALFHHEPEYLDKKVLSILRSAKWYLDHLKNKGMNIILAKEGLELDI